MPYKDIEKRRELDRRRYKENPNRKAQQAKHKAEYQKTFPERQSAVTKVYKAIKSGRMVRPSKCCLCPETENIIGHHTDYNEPLCVVWLCCKCHKKVHIYVT